LRILDESRNDFLEEDDEKSSFIQENSNTKCARLPKEIFHLANTLRNG
jgi:hypothetical protein